MVVKPHLAIGLGLLPLLLRRWRVVGLAALVAALFSLLATAMFGIGVWPAFLGGVEASAHYLRDGFFPMFRMASLYAVALLAGASASAAMLVQAAGAATGLAVLLAGHWHGLHPRRQLALAVLASLLVSPDLYDYDLPMLGVVAALLAPDVAAVATAAERRGFMLLCWLVPTAGMMNWVLRGIDLVTNDSSIGKEAWRADRIALAGLGLLLLLWLVARIVLRAEAASRSR